MIISDSIRAWVRNHTFMDPEERKERLDALMDGNAIHCDKVGELIDACKDKCYELTARESEAVSLFSKV